MNDALGRIEKLEEEVAKLKQQVTEPMRVTRIELDPGGIQNGLDAHAEILKELSAEQKSQGELLQVLFNQSGQQATDIGVLKQDVSTLKTDVSTLKHTVARLEQKMDEGFQDMEKRFDAIAEVQKLILERLPEKGE